MKKAYLIILAALALMAASVMPAGAGAAASRTAAPGTAVPGTAVPGTAVPGTGHKNTGVKLSWQAPKDVVSSKIAGYNIYRSDKIPTGYKKINKQTVKDLHYEDKGLVWNKAYFYEVCTVMTGGRQSAPTKPVGIRAGTNQPYTPPAITSFTSDADGKVLYLGGEAAFILNGSPGLKASFEIDGMRGKARMKEVSPGTYKGQYKVRPRVRIKDAFATAVISDQYGGEATARTDADLNFSGQKEPALKGFYAGMLESDRVGLNWPVSETDEGCFNLYRGTSKIVGTEGLTPLSANINPGASSYVDDTVQAGKKYYYVLAEDDASGIETAVSRNLEVKVPEPGHASGIAKVEEDSGGKTLKPGDLLNVTVNTSSGGKALFSIGNAARGEGALTEGPAGVYKGAWTVKEGEGVFKARVAVSFRDSYGNPHFSNSATFVSVDAPRADKPKGRKPVAIGIKDDIRTAAGPSGRLTAGKTFSATLTGEPGNKAYFRVGDTILKVPMKEETPGVYTGSYTVKPGDNAGTSGDPSRTAYLTGYLESKEGAVSDPVKGMEPVVVDTACNISAEASSKSLAADGKSKAKITFTITDADGRPVKGRRLTAMLEPPQYTGTAGSGGYPADESPSALKAAKDKLGRLQADFNGLTDASGRMTATYTSGTAAKTVLVTARDYSTGSVGIIAIATGISSSISVELTKEAEPAAMSMSREAAYGIELTVTPESGIPGASGPCITADGESRANVTATLTDRSGKPVKGKTIIFTASGAGGKFDKRSALTDALGRAQVFYIAGTKAGTTLLKATESSTKAAGTADILLVADAPARIYPQATPAALPADGSTASDITVRLTDKSGNPAEGATVGISLRGGQGNGSLSVSTAPEKSSAASGVTDSRGEANFTYTAGTVPGTVTMDISAQSEAPSDDEIKACLSRVTAPMVYDNEQYAGLTVKSWLKGIGDQVWKGEPLAVVSTPMGDMTVRSPVTGTLDGITVGPGFNVIEGREIGTVK